MHTEVALSSPGSGGQTSPAIGTRMTPDVEPAAPMTRHFSTQSEDELARALENAEHKVANLQQALATSRVIGTAVGILVERHKVTADAAFDMLVASSQHHNRKVREIADTLVFSGQLL